FEELRAPIFRELPDRAVATIPDRSANFANVEPLVRCRPHDLATRARQRFAPPRARKALRHDDAESTARVLTLPCHESHPRSRALPHHDLSAVDDDRLAGDVARLVRAQEDDGVRDVLGLDLLAERGEGVVVRDDLLGSNPLLLRRGADVLRVPDLRALENVARSDAVHSNPIASELERPASHEVDLARFRGVVGAVRFARLEA